jgi:tRNA A37 threonylcarbamoyltransferase TsaD
MGNDLIPAGGLFPSKLDRQTSRALAQLDAGALVASHRDQARIDRVASTTERGMVRAAQLGALEATLAQTVPNAAGCVHAVMTAGAIGIVAAVYEAGNGS